MKIKDEVYDFGARLKQLRKNKKLSQKEVAGRLNVDPKTISAYESNNRTPSVERLILLAILYNTSIDYILGLNHRVNIFIDDLTQDKQKLIIDFINMIRNE